MRNVFFIPEYLAWNVFIVSGASVNFKCSEDVKFHPSLDISVITLPKRYKLEGSRFKPIEIGSAGMDPETGEMAVVAGWGTFGNDQREAADTLQVRFSFLI